MIIGYAYDVRGERYQIKNMPLFIESTETDALINIYMLTVYEHHLAMSFQELVDKGIVNQVSGERYTPKNTEYTIESIKTELINQLGEAEFKKIHSKIDLSFLDRKPKLKNRKK